MNQHTIAIIFDFDDTLVPDSTTSFLKSAGIDVEEFWKIKVREHIKDGYDPVHAFLKLLLDLTKPKEPLEGLTNKQLLDFGEILEPYSGLPDFFEEMKAWVRDTFTEMELDVRYWVISGGLEEIIRGCDKITKHLTGFWGCRLAGDDSNQPLRHIKRTISFTEKTRYLFEINKGLSQKKTDKNPMLVNKEKPENTRPIPFENMIYVGDGLTDIPCLSLIMKKGGAGIGIMHQDKIDDIGKAKRQTFQELIKERRALSYHYPVYNSTSELVAMIKTIISNAYSAIELKEEGAIA